MKLFEYIYALIAIMLVGVGTVLTAPASAYIFVKESKKLAKATKLKEKLNG